MSPGGAHMEILELIDSLEELVIQARRLPVGGNIVVDRISHALGVSPSEEGNKKATGKILLFFPLRESVWHVIHFANTNPYFAD